ncbi:gas vesicle protein [Pseudonocardia alaniniphila]|uniref:Gas vesicle protein n=1 Tax=Pseudonocardia alaniniphila TaxID=75291 RepID=A0ABS9TGV3_9PSEU|nr:gas vesicle protein [Pseudonocardia alaniniphila]MCH6167511.1 gas vesicle protein [Pseudonocardia alaniniphila]
MTSGGLPLPSSRARPPEPRQDSTNLADILERVLDKGIVIAGDIRVNLLDIELLTIKIRLLVASVDKAREIGIDWWEHDPTLSSGAGRGDLAEENRLLKARIDELEASSAAELDAGSRTSERTLEAPLDDVDDVDDEAEEPAEPRPRVRRSARRPARTTERRSRRDG